MRLVYSSSIANLTTRENVLKSRFTKNLTREIYSVYSNHIRYLGNEEWTIISSAKLGSTILPRYHLPTQRLCKIEVPSFALEWPFIPSPLSSITISLISITFLCLQILLHTTNRARIKMQGPKQRKQIWKAARIITGLIKLSQCFLNWLTK